MSKKDLEAEKIDENSDSVARVYELGYLLVPTLALDACCRCGFGAGDDLFPGARKIQG